MNIPLREPDKLRAGDTWQWRRDDLSGDYPAPTWTLTYYCKSADDSFAITAAADGVSFSVSVPSATTTAKRTGLYAIVGSVSDGTNRFEVYRGRFEVLPDFSSDGLADPRTHVRKVVEAIEAVLENRATQPQEELTISGLMLRRTPIPDLLKLRDKYRAELVREEAASDLARGVGGRGIMRVRL